LATKVSLKFVWHSGTVPICKFYPHHIDADPDADPDPDYQLMWIRMPIRIRLVTLMRIRIWIQVLKMMRIHNTAYAAPYLV
jgi:hypothetical protein